MSLIEKYELLNKQGSWIDRLKYILSLSNKTEIETHLKKSSFVSYDDLQTLVFLSKSTKNQTNLIEIFKSDSLPVRQRIEAAKAWLQLQKDEKQIHQFVVETITDSNIPQLIKYQILKYLHRIHCLKTSDLFFNNLACELTESFNHDQFNIDAHTLPFCSFNQIMNLLSRWSLRRYSQICYSSPFCSKLIRYQPLIIIHLIQGDLNDKYTNNDELWNYFRVNKQLFELLTKKEPQAMCHFVIEHVNRLEKDKKVLPAFVESKQEYLFAKAPEEMIKLISLVASYQPGTIKHAASWDRSDYKLSFFEFPPSFSIDHYIRLFFVLYETCQWSLNNIHCLIDYMLHNGVTAKKLSFLRKQRKWFIDIIIQERIGKEEFLNKLFKIGTERQLSSLSDFPELSDPFARHLLIQYDQSELTNAEQHAIFLRYELMTSEVFDKFLSLFQQIGSDVNQRKRMYIRFLQCAISTDEQSVKRVLQWIQKRFTNEQLVVIECFLSNLSTYDDRFHLEYLPNNFETIEAIMDLAFNHLQRTLTTVETILAYASFLLLRADDHHEKIQEFACQIIKRYYSTNATFPYDYVLSPMGRHHFTNLLISDIFPKLISKCSVTEINNFLMKCFHNASSLPQIDLFLESFFFEHLRYSSKLQSRFDIDEHSFLISLFLKPRSTRLERVHRLLNEIDQIFFLHIDVQRTILHCQQYRQFIDKLLEDEKCVNAMKLSTGQSNLSSNKKLAGFDITVLNNCYHQLTGQQQEQITKIILNDYLQDTEISNLQKLKALRVLRRLSHTHNETLQWIEEKQDPFLSVGSDTSSSNHSNRGANIQTINSYIISLPATFDLFPQNLFKQFDRLTAQLNASNAIFIRDAILSISQKVTDEYFLKHYLEFLRSEHLSKLGITANKAMLRLLIQYRFDSSLITSIIKPIWDSRPHPDIRACLIMILLQFIHESNMNNDKSFVVWSILEEAAYDDYYPVILAIFGANGKGIRRSSRGLKDSSTNLLQTFVQRIQMKILDHPTSLSARIWAWSLLDGQYCHINIVIEKGRQLCIQFDKNANVLWKEAFKTILSFYKEQKISAKDIVDFIQSIIDYGKELDSNQNAIDEQNDLPVYHRINNLLDLVISSIGEIDHEERLCFRSFALSILQFEITMATLVGKLLMKLAKNKEDLAEMLTTFQQQLPAIYFEHIIMKLASYLSANDGSCPFVQQLNVDEKFQLTLWFINEKNQPLFVFDLLKNHVFNQITVDKQQCQTLLRQMRQSKNLLLRQEALEYKVPWKNDGTINNDDQ